MKSKKELNKQNRQAKSAARKSKIDKRYWYGLFAVAIIGFIIYSPVLQNGFVWDDEDYILDNPLIRSINIGEIFSNYLMGNYHPLTVLVHAIEYKLFGTSESGYHFVNMLIHVINSLLVFYAVYLISEKELAAIVASLLFAVHPLHVESVAWAAELKDLLYSLFFILSLIYYLCFLRDQKKKYFYLSVILFLLALLSKAMAASLPVVLLLVDYFKGRKFNSKLITEKIPYFALAFIFGIVAILAQKESYATDIAVFPFFQRIFFASYGFIMYLAKLGVPFDLCAYYPYPIRQGQDIPGEFYLFPLLVIALLVFTFYSLRKTKKLFFGIGFFSITVFLVLQLLPVGGAIMADRYSYIPSIGIFYLAGEGFLWLWNRRSLRAVTAIVAAGAVIFYSAETKARCGIWKNGMTLWNDVIDQYQTIPQAYINRGIIFASEKKYEEAMNDYNFAIRIEPRFSKAYNNRGGLLRTLKRYEEAITDFNKAIELQPDYVIALNNRGLLMNITQRYDQAVLDFSKAIKLKPDYTDAFHNRGVSYRNMNRFDEAINDFNKALQLNPNYFRSYSERGIVLASQGKNDEAIRDYNRAIQLNPEYANGYFNKGNLLMNLKKYNEAIGEFNKAIQVNPNLAEAYYNRGISSYNTGQNVQACNDLKKAAEFGLQYAANEYARICR